MDSSDVIILGAGAAGLAAAGALTAKGLRVVILEARARVGGRIFTHPDTSDDAVIELGAEFVHGRPPEIFDLARHASLDIREIEGQPWMSRDGNLAPAEAFFDAESGVFERLEDLTGPDRSFRQFLEECCSDLPPQARLWATSYVEGFHAAFADRISVYSIREGEKSEEAIDGDRQFRVVGGYQRVVNALRATIDPARSALHLQHTVTEVDWRGPGVQVHTLTPEGERDFAAPVAIVTLPLSILQQTGDSLRFIPPLAGKQEALAHLEMGRVIRVVLRFREPFWRSLRPGPHGTANMTFLFASAQPLPTWWTAWPSPAPLITGWAAGPKAQNLPADTAQLEAIALSSLASAVNLPELRIRGLLQACYFHDWQADPFARGAYSYVKVGGAQSAQAQLAQPLANRLFFAGEATCSDGHHATVHGAIASGTRAAGEVMRLRRVSRA